MRVQDALDQLDQIHDQLTRSEVYRGFRVPAVALVGALGLLAAALQPHAPDIGFVEYWLGVAGVGAAVGFGAVLRAYLFREDEFARRRTRRVLAQFLPCVLAGGAVTLAVAHRAPEFVAFLPGLWAVVFGLGVIAARPHLPVALWWIGLGYVLAGAAVLARTDPAEPSGWAVGGVFGIGHFVTAIVLWADKGDDDG